MGGFTAALQRFGIGRLTVVLGVAAGITIALILIMMRVGQAPDALLYSNLDLREASEVTTALDSAGIKYSSKGDGSTIFVSRDQVGEARMLVAGKGLVTSGSVGYEIFDNQSVLGQTEFQQNLNAKRALEGELSRTIMSMRGINSARVMIALPERQLFATQAGEPTAAVVVGVTGSQLSGAQVQSIRNVVASSIPNMKPEKVTLTDTSNRTLAAGTNGDGFSAASAEEARGQTESQLQARIKDIVEGVVGVGAARVQVTAEIDHSRSTTQQQQYDPDGQVVRSTSTNGSESQDTTGASDGGATATNNIPGGQAPGITPVGSRDTQNTETTNYEISNTTTTTVKEAGEIKKLAVAVVVDGKYTPPASGNGEPTYAPVSEEDRAKIDALVKAAIGFNAERGDTVQVTAMRFNRDASTVGGEEGKSSLFDFTKNDIMRGVELLVLLITGLLLIFFVLRPLLKTAQGGGAGMPQLAGAGGAPVTQLQTAMVAGGDPMAHQSQMLLPPSEMDHRIDIARFEGQVKASSIKKVSDFVEKHPDESTAILRSWVHEG
ncbi:MAG: flagellar M-ring protein FliF [Brevundimonas sp.]|nr:MAG: flagellar M-ring protein FliF [Brevundimonas sp.]